MDQYYIGANGVLRCKQRQFHYPVEGFKAPAAAAQHGEPNWILSEDIHPTSTPTGPPRTGYGAYPANG